MKFKAKAKDCQLLVKAKTSIGESIDEKELDRFSRVYLRGFLKPKMVKRNLIEYTGPVGISLYERLKKPTNKREFLFILEQIVVAVQKLQANGMGLNNLVIDLQHVYINEVTKETQFIYIPIYSLFFSFMLFDGVSLVVGVLNIIFGIIGAIKIRKVNAAYELLCKNGTKPKTLI